jgi:SAM-dependent methyltransferase
MNPLTRFSERVADYVKYRPSYPAAAIDKILEGLGSPSQLVAADVGAGTGISSRLLAERGVKAIAIEPNAEMRQAAFPHPLVEYRDATAEATGLPDASVDLVACFQSFHWFDLETTLLEFHRILKPSGRLVLSWKYGDTSDKFTAQYTRIVGRAVTRDSQTYLEKNKLNDLVKLFSYLVKYRRSLQNWRFRYLSAFVSVLRGIHDKQELDLAGLIGLARSQSIVSLAEPVQQQLRNDLQQLYESNCDRDGLVYLAYRTILFIAEPRP